jgi:hypothetical protein
MGERGGGPAWWLELDEGERRGPAGMADESDSIEKGF